MFQNFDTATRPDQGPPRLARLRAALKRDGLNGFLVPRSDAFQGEYVAKADERLAWLTGFTGSAGFCAALQGNAGVFVDGRYRVQVRAQVDTDAFSPVNWPETSLADWLKSQLPAGGKIGFDPWLHTAAEIEKTRTELADAGVSLRPSDNLIDRVWTDKPPRPAEPAVAQPIAFSGQTSADKRAECAAALGTSGHRAAVVTLPDSICWLLNMRGTDIAHNPVVQCFAILFDDGRVTLFSDIAKFDAFERDRGVELSDWAAFEPALKALTGPVRIEKSSAPVAISDILNDQGIGVAWGDDPCSMPKACKNATEIAGTKEAHLRDGAAMVAFLAWFDENAARGQLTEIDIVTRLETERRATNALRDISFDTIAGTGANGAVIHYRVTKETNARLKDGQLIVVDSGGQYQDGTTDITRTLAIGEPGLEERRCFTRVLQGMIAISQARFPVGVSGAHLDALARAPLWLAGQDYDHGTGHGVGAYLSVHEGPQRLARSSTVPLKPGMILSNEPGYYREGAFGIRIENLIVVTPAPPLEGADDRKMYAFETLTFVPIARNLIDISMLSAQERSWINTYHAAVFEQIGPRVTGATNDWLAAATAPL